MASGNIIQLLRFFILAAGETASPSDSSEIDVGTSMWVHISAFNYLILVYCYQLSVYDSWNEACLRIAIELATEFEYVT